METLNGYRIIGSMETGEGLRVILGQSDRGYVTALALVADHPDHDGTWISGHYFDFHAGRTDMEQRVTAIRDFALRSGIKSLI